MARQAPQDGKETRYRGPRSKSCRMRVSSGAQRERVSAVHCHRAPRHRADGRDSCLPSLVVTLGFEEASEMAARRRQARG